MFPQPYNVRGYSQKRGVHIVRNYVSNKFILTPPVQCISQNLSSSTKYFVFTSIHMFNVSNIVASWSSTHTYQNDYVGLKPEIMTYGALYIIKKIIWLLKYFLITNLLFCNGEFMDKLLSHHHSALTLTLTYIFKVIRPWLWKSCPLCNVFSSWSIIYIFASNNHYH